MDEAADELVRRHRLAERLLVDVIGLEWEKVHREASGWESVISADVERKLVELLGDPATCPHGNPIPGTGRPADGRPAMTLADAPPGPFTVRRISEELEDDEAVLALLARARLIPGCAATVVGAGSGGVAVTTPVGTEVIPEAVAGRLWLSPAAD